MVNQNDNPSESGTENLMLRRGSNQRRRDQELELERDIQMSGIDETDIAQQQRILE